MHPRNNTHGALVPAAIAVAVAVIGTAALFVTELRTKEVAGNGIGMITTAVVEKAGATAYPTARDIGADQIHYVP
ncbi:hypothetical protein [Bradyrhizobium sp. AUGA SZCCT0431]|uniref:hypothetical protein n=1 Tax=Bradyrhizobium sp. AUGA SZCCT0431 TaxID=2807674 RepID=UPI001BA66A44|nr:hypothetical protein [Bradyrhizobium sp. AUGA SZCCT0431]MBR1146853.1 hypothetical protein [Bradyrhizobium sp. AUGA SZCCT0431]